LRGREVGGRLVRREKGVRGELGEIGPAILIKEVIG